jgi:hypothetical protein
MRMHRLTQGDGSACRLDRVFEGEIEQCVVRHGHVLRVEGVTEALEEAGRGQRTHAVRIGDLDAIHAWIATNAELAAGTVQREWHDGDQVKLELPMQLHSETLSGDDSLRAMLYGTNWCWWHGRVAKDWATPCNMGVLRRRSRSVARPLPAPQIAADGKPQDKQWMRIVSESDLRFEAATRQGTADVALLNQLQAEHYTAYWRDETDG